MIALREPAQASLPRPPPTERDYLSYSSINAYRRCPLSYFFKYVVSCTAGLVEGPPEETWTGSELEALLGMLLDDADAVD